MLGVVAVLGLLGVAAGGLYAYVEYRFHQIHREAVAGLAPVRAVKGRDAGDSPYTVLMVGDNCRNCLDETTYGTAQEVGGGRSDVTMLLHVDPQKNAISILSIPRDLWLPIPGTDGQIRVDAALNDGPGRLVSTIQDDLGIPINHYVELNFDTFKDVVGALGGLNMDFPTRMYDGYSDLNAPPGCYHLDGFQALQVVRARHLYYVQGGSWQYDGLGDISRIQRDHEFLRVLAAAVRAKGLGDPVTDNDLLGVVAKDLTIDSHFSLGDLLSLAETLSHADLDTAPQVTLPVDEDNSPDRFTFQGDQYGDVVFPTWASDRHYIHAFDGATAALPAAASVPVRVIDVSGTSGRAQQVAERLHALGFPVTGASEGTVPSTPAETVVYYAPGHEAAAQRVADELDGAVAMGVDAQLAGTGVTVAAGSNLTVATPAPATATQPGASTGHPATTVPPATAIGGVTDADPSYPSFDPRGCPAHTSAPPLPTLAVPSQNVLPQT